MFFASVNSTISARSDIDIVSCPMCALPAFVESRFYLDSSDGPLEHLRASCVHRHSTVQLAERVIEVLLPASAPPHQLRPATRTETTHQ
jgi:hypothetical protein